MPSPDADALLAALMDEDDAAEVPPGTPLRVLREIANGANDTARVAAARILLDREDAARERRKREADRSTEGAALDIAREVMAMSDVELDQTLRDYFTDPAPRPQIEPAELDRRVEARIRAKIAAGQLIEVTDQTERADEGDDQRQAPDRPTTDRPRDRWGDPLPPGIDEPEAVEAAWPSRRRLTGGRGPQGQGIG